jgi:hypothetical protein
MNDGAQARRNHYVAVWFQKRFLTPEHSTFWYLDLRPDTVRIHRGKTYQRRALLHWSPSKCFYQDDLYTVQTGAFTNDEIERRFFGPIDTNGKTAVEFFERYTFRKGANDAVHNLIRYMDAQRIRTPRGLAWLASIARTRSHNTTLFAMQAVSQINTTMWMEGVWEIVHAHKSRTKLLLTDQPVTLYNAKAFPGSLSCKYPNDVALEEVGTRTLFPLSLDSCLIITHLQLTRDPWANARQPRANARSFSNTMMSMLDIQSGRELEEEEVIKINFILKNRASRYVAAVEKEWLFPERHVTTAHWSKLDDDWFLFPNLYKVPFSDSFIIGYKGGGSFAMDAYGRRPGDPDYQNKQQHDYEWKRRLKAQKEWAVKRRGHSVAHVHEERHDSAQDEIMADDLHELGFGDSAK